MDRSKVKAIVDRELQGLMLRLGVPHWQITVAYEPETANNNGFIRKGLCSTSIDYNSACITLNPEAFEQESDVLRTLRHELFHVVLAPNDIYTNAVLHALGETNAALNATLASVRTHAEEQAVIALERMYAGLTPPESS